MTDVSPPHPPNPKTAAKGLAGIIKGKKPMWVWVAGVTVLIGVAYVVWKRGQAATTTDTGTVPVDSSTGPVSGDYGYDNSLVPAASQGAYGGFDTPLGSGGTTAVDNAGTPESPLVSITVPGPVDGSNVLANAGGVATVGAAVTGGGHPARSVQHHLPVSHPAHTEAKPKAPNQEQSHGEQTWEGHTLSWWKSAGNAKHSGKWRWPGEHDYRHSRAFAGH